MGGLKGWLALSRWRVVVGLSGLSLVPHLSPRLLGWIGGGLSDLVAVALVGAVVTPSLLSASDVALAVSWVLLAYLAYSYSPVLYPGSPETVGRRGFRALTAVCTLWFGIALWGQIVDGVVPSAVAPAGDGVAAEFVPALVGLLVGLVVGTWLFRRYLSRSDALVFTDGRPTRTPYVDVVDRFFGGLELDEEADAARSSRYWRLYFTVGAAVLFSIVPVFVAAVAGLVAVLLQMIYPLPEVLFVVGLVGVRVADVLGVDDRFPGRSAFDLDVRLLDSISGATRHAKGLFMMLYCFLGLLLSGLAFAGSVSVLARAVTGAATGRLSDLPGLGTLSASQVAILGVVVLTLVWFLAYGLFALFYWVRQLERIQPYAAHWHAVRDGHPTALPPAPVGRPSGLLLQISLPVAGLVALLLAIGHGLLDARVAVGVWGLVCVASLVLVGWSLSRLRRGHAPPLTHESRDVLVATLGQYASVSLFGFVGPEARFDASVLPVYLLIVVGLLLGYWRVEWVYWEREVEGGNRLVRSVASTLVVIAFILFAFRIAVPDLPGFVYGVIAALGLANVATTAVEYLHDRGGPV